MRIMLSLSHALSNLLLLCLSTCIVVSATGFESMLRNVQHKTLPRSLPESLAYAPEGAVGYPPPPIVHEPSPAAASEADDTPMVSTARNTDDDVGYGSKKEMAATDGSDGYNEYHGHIPSVSQMDAMIAAAQTGSASRYMVRSVVSLAVSISVSLVHL
ncbi:hypothetical protein BJX61DRAFT_544754 [Aspergillus egyptiacus]|nr:hypothetical protein BJX61DRAFT_544754 [Aspergillus egyptiacus]